MYTTSLSIMGEDGLSLNVKLPLHCKTGLRQSDAVFLHLKNVNEFLEIHKPVGKILSVAYSKTPRDIPGSYMPVFTVGQCLAKCIAFASGAKLYPTAHQNAHIYSAVMFEKQPVSGKYLCFHASGGTTEILQVSFDDGLIQNISLLGGTKDITGGKLTDRTGVLLNLPFPAGQFMEEIAVETNQTLCVRVDGCSCNLSGAEAQAKALVQGDVFPGEVAQAVFHCLAETFYNMILSARKQTGIKKLIAFGGTFQNGYIKNKLEEWLLKDSGNWEIIYAPRGFSCDNAAGLAHFAKQMFEREAQ